MKLAVPRTGTALALAGLAVAAGAYRWSPAVARTVDPAIRALTAPDGGDAVQAFRSWALGFGAWAPLASAALMVLQAVVAPLPAFVITLANGLVFGWAWGALLSWASAMAGAALCFGLGRALGRPAVERLLGGAGALERADRFFARHGRGAILLARLVPFVPFDAVSYGAGLTSTRLGPFLVATGIGQLPATLAYSWLGERVAGAARVVLWAFSLGLAALVLAWMAAAAVRASRLRPAPRTPGGDGP